MWREVDGFEGYYEVSDTGEVRSVDRYVKNTRGRHAGIERFLHGAIMRQTLNTCNNGSGGYYVVNLHKNGMSSVIPVHSIIAKAFIPNPDNMPTVNHIDGNKQNNEISNLEWVSYSDNNTHALRLGLRSPRGCRVSQYSKDGVFLREYKSVSEAARISGVSRGMISHCINGRLKHASSFVWKKLSESPTTIPNGSTREDELPAEAQRPFERTEDIVCTVSNNG